PALQDLFRFRRGQQGEFLHSRFPQPGVDLVEVGVVVPRVADKLPCPFWNAVGDRGEQFQVETSGEQHGERSVGRAQAVGLDLAGEPRGKVAQHIQFRDTPPQLALSQQIYYRQWPYPAKWIAHGRNATLPRRSQQWPQHRGKHVGMLVGVEMRGPHPRRLQALDLSAGFSFDLGRVELVAERSYDKVIELDTKLAATVLCTWLQQAAYLIRRQQRSAVEQHHVTADAEARVVVRQRAHHAGRFVESSRVRHQRGRGHNPALLRLHDAAVHSPGQTEVVGVDDEPAHGISVAAEIG